jgi:hypothetical protein
MGIINVEGIGQIQIQGNTPTKEEIEVIEKAQKKKKFVPIPEPIETIEYKKTDDFASGLQKGFTDRETSKAAFSLGGFGYGATAGLPFGPIGSAVGGITGAVLGGTAGGQIHDIVSSYIDGNNLSLDDTSKQAFRDIKSEALWGTIGQSLPGLKPFITSLIVKKQKGKLVADDIKKAHEASKRIGVDLLPVDVSGKFGQKLLVFFPGSANL